MPKFLASYAEFKKNYFIKISEAAVSRLALNVFYFRRLDIDPRVYLEDVMRRNMSHTTQKLDELLPDQRLTARKTPDT